MSKKNLGISIPQNANLANIYGPDGAHLKQIATRFNINIDAEDYNINISGGNKKKRMLAKHAIEALTFEDEYKNEITEDIINEILQKISPEQDNTPSEKPSKTALIMKNKAKVEPRGKSQPLFLKKIFNNRVTFGIGPAGTGKTYLAVAAAIHAFENNNATFKKIVITRPAVDAGEELGFLPGDIEEKVAPYLIPLYDALYEFKGSKAVDNLIAHKEIEIVPFATMRGRTLKDAFIVLDEAQNTTDKQMKLFLTRIGRNSKVVITGDITQNDLPDNVKSGLTDALEKLKNVKGLAVHEFSSDDIERDPVVADIVKAYEKFTPK